MVILHSFVYLPQGIPIVCRIYCSREDNDKNWMVRDEPFAQERVYSINDESGWYLSKKSHNQHVPTHGHPYPGRLGIT